MPLEAIAVNRRPAPRKAYRTETVTVSMTRHTASPHRLYTRPLAEHNFKRKPNQLSSCLNWLKSKTFTHVCSLAMLPNVVQMMSHAFNKIVSGSLILFLSIAVTRWMNVSTWMSLLFHCFNSIPLLVSSSSSNARILSSNVVFYLSERPSEIKFGSVATKLQLPLFPFVQRSLFAETVARSLSAPGRKRNDTLGQFVPTNRT